jgi:hypothetical protein
MRHQEGGYDYRRYRQLLAEADDETKRLALIKLLIEEKARDRLAAERASDRAAMTAMTVAKVLRNPSGSINGAYAPQRLNLVTLRSVKDAPQRSEMLLACKAHGQPAATKTGTQYRSDYPGSTSLRNRAPNGL